MGVLQRFERRLGGLVEGAFARVFGGVVQPVEVAARLQREADDKKAIVGAGRVLVPNEYVVELGESDFTRLTEYDAALRRELAAMVQEHAVEQGWSFVGPVDVRLTHVDGLDTGVFHVTSAVVTSDAPRRVPLPPTVERAHPYLLLGGGDHGAERVVPLSRQVTKLGRGADADVRLPDTGVSRLHAEVRLEPDAPWVVDLGSTNGTTVNGRRISRAPLSDGDRIGLGPAALVYRAGG